MSVPANGAQVPPSSPQRSATTTVPDVNKLQSTPSNRGLSAASNLGIHDVVIDNLSPRVKEELRKAHHCDDTDRVLKHFLRLASAHPDSVDQEAVLDKCLKEVLPICNGQDTNFPDGTNIKVSLEKYTQVAKVSDMYTPFVDASNTALECLRDLKIDGMCDPVAEMNIVFQRSDLTVIAQNHGQKTSYRKPDVIVVNKRPHRSKEGRDDDSQRPNKNTKPNIIWQDVFSVVEFKRCKSMRSPPKEYVLSSCTNVVDPTSELYDVPPDQAQLADGTQSGALSQAQQNPSSKRRSEGDPVERLAKRSRSQNQSTTVAPPAAAAPAQVQAALYGAEMLSANVVVNYVINFTVRNDEIWIWIYDHQGVLSVRGFNFVQDLPRFMVLLYALQRFQLDEWGRISKFKIREGGKKMEVTLPDENGIQCKLVLSNPARMPPIALNGRGTEVMDLICPDLEGKEDHLKEDGMVAKIYWGEERRVSEAAILDVVKDIAAVNDDVKGHVPIVLLSHKFDVSTSNIREALGIEPEDARKGSRTLYLIAFRKLRPIWDLQPQPEELRETWCQIVLCHYGLWKGNVHHRDLSASNLMYRRADGVLIGVLNDFDLATLAGSGRTFGNERTGTIPFMAIDLLTEDGQNGHVEHLYRHDMESFIWAFTWISCQYKDGKFRGGYFAEWATLDANRCVEKKTSFLLAAENKIPSDLVPTVRIRVVRYTDHILQRLLSRQSNNRQLGLLQMENPSPKDPNVQIKIAELQDRVKEKGVDEVFREFAAAVGYAEVDAVIERAAKSILKLSPRSLSS